MDFSSNIPQNIPQESKGRGFDLEVDNSKYVGDAGKFDTFQSSHQFSTNALQSVEGWVLFINNIHPEAIEEDLVEAFSDYGEVKQIRFNLDRRTGMAKGYALIQYEDYMSAQEALTSLDGASFLDQELHVTWAFQK